ncbi:MAG TPA: RusA family crossover junction endodeoxyribonuclease [Thermoanaerobaculia bacterium]|nr:RusA family crossover junction endodeoxyribonuclease [Thermoanaerobaculia bacterium]
MRTLTFAIPGTPIPQARSRHRVVKLRNGATFAQQYDPAESRIWKATVAEFAARAMAGQRPIEGPVSVELVFMFLPTASWSKRKLAELRTAGELARPVKPDLDNLIKGVVDGMKGIVFRDDGQIWSYGHSRKVYGLHAEVRIRVAACEEPARKTTLVEATELPLLAGGMR